MKCLSSIALFCSLLFFSLDARSGWYDEKGMATYNRVCKSCHGGPYKGAAMQSKRDWKQLFASEAKGLKTVHGNVPKAHKSIDKTLSKSRRRHLEKFLIQSASDSGVVPGCDGNYCGDS